MQHTRWMGALALTLTISSGLGAVGCGGPAATASNETARTETATAHTSWTAAQLRKLDPRLRARVRAGEREHVAVEVTFAHVPDEDVLGDLLLSRVGGMVVGRVQLATLHAIAARDDVERIEVLADEGYDTL